jgi:hypothetical protein
MAAPSLACHGKAYGIDQPVSLPWNTGVRSNPTARTAFHADLTVLFVMQYCHITWDCTMK